MIVKIGNILTDGKRSVRVPRFFAAWHSEMDISDIDEGEPVETVPIPARIPEQWELQGPNLPPPNFDWIPKGRVGYSPGRWHGRCPTKRSLR